MELLVKSKDTPLEEHCGTFSISRTLLRERPDLVGQVFWQCIPIRAEMHCYTDEIEYTAFSRNFQHQPPGMLPTHYRAVFNGDRFVGFESP